MNILNKLKDLKNDPLLFHKACTAGGALLGFILAVAISEMRSEPFGEIEEVPPW